MLENQLLSRLNNLNFCQSIGDGPFNARKADVILVRALEFSLLAVGAVRGAPFGIGRFLYLLPMGKRFAVERAVAAVAATLSVTTAFVALEDAVVNITRISVVKLLLLVIFLATAAMLNVLGESFAGVLS